MRRASLLLTSMPGIRVLDAHVHIGCHHLPSLKVHHQLTLAGIEGAMLVAGPETLDLPYSYPGAAEVADCWRHPRYLTRRGNFHSQKCSHPWLAPIPATPTHLGCVSRSHQLRPCDDLDLIDDVLMLADGNECLTQCPRAHCFQLAYWKSHWGSAPRPHALASTLDFPHKASQNMPRGNVKGHSSRWSSCGIDWSSGNLGCSAK